MLFLEYIYNVVGILPNLLELFKMIFTREYLEQDEYMKTKVVAPWGIPIDDLIQVW